MRQGSRWSLVAKGLSGERGSMAVIAILGMALLLVITVAFVALAQLETKIGVNHAQEIQATQAGEAGARRVVREILDGAETGAQWVAKAQPVRTGTLAAGSYSVTVATSTMPDSWAVQSTGTSGGARSVVTLLVSPTTYPHDAVAMGGLLIIPGSPVIQGTCGSVNVYTSGSDSTDTTVDINVSGHPIVSQGMSTDSVTPQSVNGSYYKSTSPLPSPAPAQVAPAYAVAGNSIPPIVVTYYAQYADFLLNSDGWAYTWVSGAADAGTFCTSKISACGTPSGWNRITIDDSGNPITLPMTIACVKGWKWDQSAASNRPARWKDCGTSFADGTYYVKGAVTIATNYATTTHTTLITEAYMDFSGSPQFIGDNASGWGTNPTFPRDILLVAGTDIKMSSSLSNLVGVIAAHEQIELDNVGTLNGMLIAEDFGEGMNSWPTYDGHITQNKINNSPHITYNCGTLQPAGLGKAGSVTKWLGR